MGKRKLNIQQRARITKAQHQHLDGDVQTGLVLCSFGKQAEVETELGERIMCLLRPNLPTLVAGDQVVWQALPEAKKGVIVSCHPRKTVLVRRLNKPGLNQPLAANLTQLVVVIAPKPDVTWSLLDTYLITAETLKLQVCIVLNKTDLPSSTIQTALESYYEPLGYAIFYTNKQDEQSLLPLENQLTHQTSIVVGQSGVGKSSLINRLLPHLAAQIETLPLTKKEHGQHTTSEARFYHLPKGGAIIDSPGVRAFHPESLTPALILKGYRELHPFLGQCQFRNCRHLVDKGCAITSALEKNQISMFRYQILMHLLKQEV